MFRVPHRPKSAKRVVAGANASKTPLSERLEAMPDQVKQFVFAGTTRPRSLGSAKAYFYSLLLLDPDSMQRNCIAVGELQAVLGGLLLSLTTVHKASRSANPGWSAEMTAGDWIDGINLMSTYAMLVTALIGFACAVLCSAAGANKSIGFYDAVTDVLGQGMALLNVGVMCSMIVIGWDHYQTMHPIPAAVFMCVGVAMYLRCSHLMVVRVLFEKMPLELFHMPYFLRSQMIAYALMSITPSKVEAAAVREAATLREGFLPPQSGQAVRDTEDADAQEAVVVPGLVNSSAYFA